MAGDWLKMRVDLQSHPKVVRILSAICPHANGIVSDKFRVIGGLHAAWSVFDTHSEDGVLDGYTPKMLDHVIGFEGLAEAMIKVGWLEYDGAETLMMPEFDEHNGQSAKRRAEDQKRKRESRKRPQSVRKMSANEADEMRTREEKRREEIKDIPHTPQAGRKSGAIGLQTYLQNCKDEGKKPIPEDHSVFEYATAVGLPHDFLRLQWLEFKDRYTQPDAKRYKAWPVVFSKSVRGNWFKLWYADNNGGYALTTTGLQAEKLHKGG